MKHEFGTIYTTRTEGAYMQPPTYTYRFDGDVFLIPRDLIAYELPHPPKIGRRFVIGDTPLVNVEGDPWSDHIIAVREKKILLIAYYRIARPASRFFRLFYSRLIVTLAVWNLAEIEQGEIANLKRALLRRWRKR